MVDKCAEKERKRESEREKTDCWRERKENRKGRRRDRKERDLTLTLDYSSSDMLQILSSGLEPEIGSYNRTSPRLFRTRSSVPGKNAIAADINIFEAYLNGSLY